MCASTKNTPHIYCQERGWTHFVLCFSTLYNRHVLIPNVATYQMSLIYQIYIRYCLDPSDSRHPLSGFKDVQDLSWDQVFCARSSVVYSEQCLRSKLEGFQRISL